MALEDEWFGSACIVYILLVLLLVDFNPFRNTVLLELPSIIKVNRFTVTTCSMVVDVDGCRCR
jgi:hypothetical protein